MEYTTLKFEHKGLTEEGDNYILTGVFSTPDIDYGDDIVEKAAVQKSIEKYGLPVFRHQHDGLQKPLGTITEVRYDGEKSILVAKMPKKVQSSADAAILASEGAYKGLSIGYRIEEDGCKWEKGGIRRITDLHIFEVSLVDTPMNKNAELISVKKRAIKMQLDKIDSLSDVEAFVKNLGLSNTESKSFVSKVKPVFQRDAEEKSLRDAEAEKEREELKKSIREEVEAEMHEEAEAKAKEEAEAKRIADEKEIINKDNEELKSILEVLKSNKG